MIVTSPIELTGSEIRWRPGAREAGEVLLHGSEVEDPEADAVSVPMARLTDALTAIRLAYAQGRRDAAVERAAVLRGLMEA